RRSPAADAATRTIHVEIDLPDPRRTLPVGTTAELTVDVGQPIPAREVPLTAASIRGEKATLFAIEGDIARKHVVSIKGERAGSLFLDPSLPPGTRVVVEGRAQLADGDRVQAGREIARP